MIPGPFSKIAKQPLSNFKKEQTEMTMIYHPTDESIESISQDEADVI